ncbi:type I-E CRISPR-associated protein Cse2/CasB [Saccharospirillum impatiens]|uniref:type I-E CRISPR-associated protein Cse2/CasB n=1 Tax=Saccharospirillum impatiens TaxID=169438 RepID=UPI00048DB9E4|nr:type I-E CRISPR-associated protein Cse2/CasB [Saccharospirillum impatiens]
MTISDKKAGNEGEIAYQCISWWRRTISKEPVEDGDTRKRPTAYRATLKRCTSIDDVLVTEAFQQLWLSLPSDIRTPRRMVLVAMLAWLLAAVKQDGPQSIAKAMASTRGPESDSPTVSQIRFQQLVHARTPEEFVSRVRRILAQIGGTVNVASFVKEVEGWYWQSQSKETDIDPTRRQTLKWAMEYYESQPRKFN